MCTPVLESELIRFLDYVNANGRSVTGPFDPGVVIKAQHQGYLTIKVKGNTLLYEISDEGVEHLRSMQRVFPGIQVG